MIMPDMFEPEKSDNPFSPLSEEFNKSAKAFATDSNAITLDGLMTKFNILWKFKAQTPEDQGRLTQGLFEGGMEILCNCALPSNHESLATPTTSMQQVFNFLTTPEQLKFLPENACNRMADAALNLIRKSENARYEYGWKDYAQHKGDLVKMAQVTAGYAEKMRQPDTGTGLAAAKGIAPAKRLTLSSQGQSA